MSTKTEKKFQLGASPTIGEHILPGKPIDTIFQKVNQKIKLTIAPCNEIIKALKEDKLDLGFIESPIFDDALVYREWMEDELVVCSKKQLPHALHREELNHCRIVCRESASPTRVFIEDFFETQGLSYYDFASISEVNNPTAIIQSIKWSKPHAPITAVAIVSKLAIEHELKYNDLYISYINNQPMMRKFYILYKEESAYIESIREILLELI